MLTSHARTLGFTGEVVVTNEIKIGAEDFKSQNINPLREKRASKAWFSIITAYIGTGLETVQSTNSPSARWWELRKRYCACGLKRRAG